eukprot:CAMPEP_0203798024 /NCGR_PEP_ID=MMETSP0100_2-20121128/8996_1 /ASSEMBLY_ACC=CAM_ASM_000210 /TAXON_ID=96639 /ORGANISM=" , Strain NY0313808BC1" /LENGTH=56 /DNA_ID=CAMNT_0050703479 /DNA_START=404 /DNA_END=571 /DNA_ORIENTATION=+
MLTQREDFFPDATGTKHEFLFNRFPSIIDNEVGMSTVVDPVEDEDKHLFVKLKGPW